MFQTPYAIASEMRKRGYNATTESYGGCIVHCVLPDEGSDKFIIAIDEGTDNQTFVLAIDAVGVPEIEPMIERATLDEVCVTLTACGITTNN